MSELTDLLDKIKHDVRPELLRPAIAEALSTSGVDMHDIRRVCQIWVDNSLIAKLSNTDFPGPDTVKEWLSPYLRNWVADLTGEMFDTFFASSPLPLTTQLIIEQVGG